MTDNLERRDLVDKADAWDAIAAKNAEITRLQEALAAAEAERDKARTIVRDIYWMALRYADGRKSYAVGMCNDAVRKAYDAGWLKHDHPSDPALARDGMSPEYAALEDRVINAEAKLASLPALLAETRKKALEEAARVVEGEFKHSDLIAARIRSLAEEAPK